MKISQLEDEVRILETKCSDLVKYKEAMLNKHVERMKLSSKVLFKIDIIVYRCNCHFCSVEKFR